MACSGPRVFMAPSTSVNARTVVESSLSFFVVEVRLVSGEPRHGLVGRTLKYRTLLSGTPSLRPATMASAGSNRASPPVSPLSW